MIRNSKRTAKDFASSGSSVIKKIKTDTGPPPLSWGPPGFNRHRGRLLTPDIDLDATSRKGDCVVLWMSRDQRAIDNHALTFAQGLAQDRHVPLKVVFNLVPKFLDATERQFSFMLQGLEEVESTLREFHIPFFLTKGDPIISVSEFVKDHCATALVCDFTPLRIPAMWTQKVAEAMNQLDIPMVQIDAHNIVPCWHASPKLEYSARTIRGKINALLPTYLKDDMPPLSLNVNGESAMEGCSPVNWKLAMASLRINREVKAVDWLQPGTNSAWEVFRNFCNTRLNIYANMRNNPNFLATSDMSPFYHFGQFSVQRAILYLKSLRKSNEGTTSYCEEALVRRELAENFCYYNPNYDNFDGLNLWAKESLDLHRNDLRKPVYTLAQFEAAETHEDLWNAAQLQMVRTGKMHGFLRMYWAKKILEWSASPEDALSISIYLNDKYQLDGRDPNGYVGCMWSIGGVHDQGWSERNIFGKIRYMNYAGCTRKFNVQQFVQQFPPAVKNAKMASQAVESSESIGNILGFIKKEEGVESKKGGKKK